MDRVLSWLNQPLFPDGMIRIWMATVVGIALLLALVLAFVLIQRKKKRDNKVTEEPVMEHSKPMPDLDLRSEERR